MLPKDVLCVVFSLCKYTQNSFSLAGLAVHGSVALIAGRLVPACKNLLEKATVRTPSSYRVPQYHSYAAGTSGLNLVFLSLSYEK